MTEKRTFIRYGKFLKWVIRITALFLISALLSACGYSREEKQQMQEISRIGKENAINYIKDKYGFTAEVGGVEVCTKRQEIFEPPTIIGCAVITMEYEGKTFQVHISGTSDTIQGTDDFQHDLISEEAKEYFAALLGYEMQDFYIEYALGQNKNLISERYQSGNIEDFMQRYPASIRIDDCKNQDFTNFSDTNPKAVTFLEQCAMDYGMKVILISYKSEEDYQKGYKHTYGRGGLLDFEIYQDGFYIDSYAIFEQENTEYNRFELQEYDGIVISCIDKIKGSDLVISSNQIKWQDLGETKKAPVSDVYSVDRAETGEITVYIPTDQFSKDWKGRRLYIQHYDQEKWWQYDVKPTYTRDGKYLFFTYHNFDGGGFDFAVFP